MGDVDVLLGLQHVVEHPLQRLGERRCGVFHPRRQRTGAAVPEPGRPGRPPGRQGPHPGQRRGEADHQGDGQQQRRQGPGDPDQADRQPVDLQRVGGTDRRARHRAEGRQHHRGQQRQPDTSRGRDAHPGQHAGRALGGVCRFRAARSGQEPDPERLDEGGHRQSRGQRHGGHRQRHHDRGRRPGGGQAVDQRLQQQPLADERRAGRERGRSQRAEPESRRGAGHPAAQAAQVVQVAAAGGGQHRPGRLEQQCLERGVVDQMQQGGGHRQPGQRQVARAGEHPGRAHPDQHQAHVLGRRVPQQPFEVRCRWPPAGSRRSPTRRPAPAPAATTSRRRPPSPPSRSKPTRMMPYTPMLTIAADISAETLLGASGCARGSHACSGTIPAFDPNPIPVATKISPATVGDSPPAASRRAGNEPSTAFAENTSSPTMMATRPRWVITAYQRPAERHGRPAAVLGDDQQQ